MSLDNILCDKSDPLMDVSIYPNNTNTRFVGEMLAKKTETPYLRAFRGFIDYSSSMRSSICCVYLISKTQHLVAKIHLFFVFRFVSGSFGNNLGTILFLTKSSAAYHRWTY